MEMPVPTGHVMMAMTLDGFIARKDHAMDWLMKQDTKGDDHGFEEFMGRIDGLVMGSGSFRTVLGFGEWPYNKPVIVMSRTMSQKDVPEALEGKVEITDLVPAALMRSLGSRGWERVYVDGSAVVQSFLREGLILDVKIAIVPILIGDGIRLFGGLDTDIGLRLLGVTEHPSGMVETRYAIG